MRFRLFPLLIIIAFEALPAEDTAMAVLSRCAACHAGAKAAAGLVLTDRGAALKGGKSGPALAPGHAADSLVYQMVSSKKMPPGSPLSAAEIEALRAWIDGGAVWTDAAEPRRAGLDWWSLQKLARPATPPIHSRTWVRNPIDAFVLAKLEAQGLGPAPEADRATLIRRAIFDLHGLPPAPEEIDAFVSDTSPRAYEKLLDRLLASPRYGERWGRHWLDVARFGESQGYERDKLRDHAWRYRDYVIQSLNSDRPYSDFVKEQIAGDVMEPATRQGIVATGFLVAGPYDEVGNEQQSTLMKTRVREEELEDIVSAVSQTFLGLTVNCARCHDHKFDPIPQRDYYRLKAVFEGARPGDRNILTPAENEARNEEIAPIQKRMGELHAEIGRLEEAARRRVLDARGVPAAEGAPKPVLSWNFDWDTPGIKTSKGRVAVKGKAPVNIPLPCDLGERTFEAWVTLANLDQRSARLIGVETKALDRTSDALVFGTRGLARWGTSSEYDYRSYAVDAPDETAAQDQIVHVAAVYHAGGRIAIYRDGAPYAAFQPAYNGGKGGLQTYRAGEAQLTIGADLYGAMDEARIYDRALSAVEIATSFRAGAQSVLAGEMLGAMSAAERDKRERLQSDLKSQEVLLKLIPSPPLAYAAVSRKPGPTVMFGRGDATNPKEEVAPGALSCLRSKPGELNVPADGSEGQRRLKLAEWIVAPDNPLTPRVIANRIWHYHFGRGIVGTPNDFGFNGDRPTHPELLDWLGAELISQGWSLKKLHKTIMQSATYMQSARFDEKAAAADADARLLWRFPPRRLEAEAVRDAMLSVSGLLNLDMAGPSFRPFQVVINNSSFYTPTDPVSPEYNRRTVYRMNVNSGRSSLLDSFDCPDPSTKTPVRGVTTTPLQALGLMNNSFVLRQARHFAQRVEVAGPDLEPRIRLAYQLAFGRSPLSTEVERAAALAKSEGMESVCWALFNATEFSYVE